MIKSLAKRWNWVLTALGLGAVYWVIESYLDVHVLGFRNTFLERLLAPDLNEAWLRLVIISLLVGFGAFMQRHVRQLNRANAEVAASEERYRTLFESSPISLFEYDLTDLMRECQGTQLRESGSVRALAAKHREKTQRCAEHVTLLDCNDYALELFGADNVDQLSSGLTAIISPESFDTLVDLIATLAGGGSRFTGDAISYDRSGKRLRTEINAQVIPDREDSRVRMIFHVDDLTYLKTTEDDLRQATDELEHRVVERTASLAESEERFRELAENIDEVFWLVDAGGNKVYVSPGYERFWQRPREELYSDSLAWLQGVHPDDREQTRKSLDQLISGRYDVEFRIVRPDGSERWVRDRGIPVKDSAGAVTRVAGITEDITFLKTANIRLQEMDRLKSMFIAGTSHELRTPLNSIIGFTSVILEGWAGEIAPEQREYLEIVHSSGKQLLQLVNDVIDITKIEAGKLDVSAEEFELRELVKEAAATVRVQAEHKNLQLNVECRPLIMFGDRRRLLQCVINLLTNAVKYTEKGSIDFISEPAGDLVELSVQDTGIGIREENIPLLFEPFIRLDEPAAARERGSGLGLYLVSKLMSEVLGGTVDVKSTYGVGSRFTLRVPVKARAK